MNLYKILEKEQRPTSFESSPEAVFFRKHLSEFAAFQNYWPFLKPSHPFDVIRANILINAALNKKAIEEAYLKKSKQEKKSDAGLPLKEFMANVLTDLFYLVFEGKRIYVPLLPSSINDIYSKDFQKLDEEPYRKLLRNYLSITVDPFDYYGLDLFDSHFTRLVPIRRKEGILAAYDYDAERLYFINSQGRLDAEVCLFDKGLLSVNKNHMMSRLLPVADAYLSNDKEGFRKALVEGKLISGTLMQRIASEERN